MAGQGFPLLTTPINEREHTDYCYLRTESDNRPLWEAVLCHFWSSELRELALRKQCRSWLLGPVWLPGNPWAHQLWWAELKQQKQKTTHFLCLHIPKAVLSFFILVLREWVSRRRKKAVWWQDHHMCPSACFHASFTLDSEIHCSLVLSSVTRHGALITGSVIHRRGNNDKGTRRKEPRREIPMWESML